MELGVHTQRHIFTPAIIGLEEHLRFYPPDLGHFSVHQAKHVAFAKELGCYVLSFLDSERNIGA